MSKQTPFFKFDALQWLGGSIQFCTLEEKGLFIDLCAMFWDTQEPVKLDQKFKVRYRNLEGTLENIIGTLSNLDIISVSEAGIVIPFLEELMTDREKWLKKCSEAGKKSAKVKGTSSNKKEERRKKSVDSRKKINTTAKADNYKKWDTDHFKTEVWKFKDDHTVETLADFFRYWSEKNTAGKMLFQLKPTWETGKRLGTWKKNNFGASKPKPQDHNEFSFADHIETRKDF